jgi:ankyrin repeat protein
MTSSILRRVIVAASACLAIPASVTAQSAMVKAVKATDRAAVTALLKERADVNAREADGTTALYWAAEKNDIAIGSALIRAGADVKAPSRYGITPLQVACLNGNAGFVELLLEAGADPNAATPGGETALMTASRTGVADAVNVLLAHSADPNAKEGLRRQTALMWAAGEGHSEAIKALLERGADLRARSNAGWTALLFAVREGHIDAVQTLLHAGTDVNDALPANTGGARRRPEGAPGGADDPRGLSALHLAVASRHYELAAMLLDKGADPNASGPGWTALHHLTWVRKPGQGTNGPPPRGSGNLDSTELIHRLAKAGANLNARVTRKPSAGTTALNFIGGTAFFLAARTADVEMMRLLVDLGADPMIQNEDGTTALMAAAGAGTYSPGEDAGLETEALEAVKLALASGNDINVVDKNGNTAMHGAAYKQLPSVVKFLADNGAKVDVWNRKNSMGWTPLRIAAGVHRGMNFRFHVPTADALRSLMVSAGVSTVLEPEKVVSGATPTK